MNQDPPSPGTLYLIPTPLGNVEDLSPRCRRLLQEVDILAAEDTRQTRSLLTVLGVARPVQTYQDHNERQQAPHLVTALRSGRSVGLVSDAGTPLLDDPGHHLVQQAIAAGIPVVSVPGPNAAITALAGAGLPVARFCYLGFPPRAEGPRRQLLVDMAHHPGSLVLLESPHRLPDCLRTCLEVLGNRPAVLAFNLSKKGEAWVRGPLAELVEQDLPKGECTVVLGGCPPDTTRDWDWARADTLARTLLEAGLPSRTVRDAVARALDLPPRQVYARVLAAREGGEE